MTATRERLRLSNGLEISITSAGDRSMPALLLLHGFPSSSKTFRDVIPSLSRTAYVIAPDLPGFGESDVLPVASFAAFGQVISEVLARLEVGPRFIYLHDYGAPVGFDVALREPDRVLGLIVQNANAHRTGFGPQWSETLSYWARPDAQNEAAATAHLTSEGTRAQYVAGLPPDIAAKISPEVWMEDWRVMSLPGRMATQRALVADYARYVGRFDAIAEYLSARQPPALLLWGRHDAFFDLAETVSWMQDLPRMEAHVFDAGHFLLETHALPAAKLISDFVARERSPS
jgi:pimeloyl-ACP methyl ester carboxylesterase